jgi:hypothetical protein
MVDMKNVKVKNPFITNGYAGPNYFCDRVKETNTIIDLMTNGNNMALISPRRIGKTELITHCFNQPEIAKNYNTFIIDIYSTNSVRDMVNVFGKAIIDGLRTKGRGAWENFLDILKSLKQEISFDINGNPSWSLSIGAITNPEITLDEIFKYLNQADKPCLVAIDEFQQITHYDDPNIEALLRTYIQRTTNANFIFSGSHRHIMGEMFISPARPFYQSVTLMSLDVLDAEKYNSFAMQKFEDYGKHLDADVVPRLFDYFNGITSYIQRIMNVMFMKTLQGATCNTPMIEESINYLLDLASETYETLLRQMPEKQRDVFIAISKEKEARNVKSGKFVQKYRLTSASSVNSAVKGLLDKDFITLKDDAYIIYDKFFELWLNRNY